MAIVLNNLAQLLQATNSLAEAEPLMRRTLAIEEAAYGPDHPTALGRPRKAPSSSILVNLIYLITSISRNQLRLEGLNRRRRRTAVIR